MHGVARAAYAPLNLTNLTNNACFDRLRRAKISLGKCEASYFSDVQIVLSFLIKTLMSTVSRRWHGRGHGQAELN